MTPVTTSPLKSVPIPTKSIRSEPEHVCDQVDDVPAVLATDDVSKAIAIGYFLYSPYGEGRSKGTLSFFHPHKDYTARVPLKIL